jgi:hypothetical protein
LLRTKIERQIHSECVTSCREELIMENMRRWIKYDWFKLIVALILLLIFIILWLQPAQELAGADIKTPVAMASTPLENTPTSSPTPSPLPSATALLPTETAIPSATPVASPTPLPTLTPTPEPTATPQPEQPTPVVQTSSGDCSKALPARLEIGKKAQVVVNLFVRNEPGMDKPVLQMSLPGKQLEIVGGPVCIPYGEGVYRWWNVKTTTAEVGWSAEGSLLGKNYFLNPIP